MRLLTTVESEADVERLELLFDASGIPTFIESDYTRDVRLVGPGCRVHVYVDDHFDDAVRLLSDPDHQVRDPVDCDEFYAALEGQQEERRKEIPQQVDRTLNWLFGLAVMISLAWVGWRVLTPG